MNEDLDLSNKEENNSTNITNNNLIKKDQDEIIYSSENIAIDKENKEDETNEETIINKEPNEKKVDTNEEIKEEEVDTKIIIEKETNSNNEENKADSEFEIISKKRLRHNKEVRAKHHEDAQSKGSLDESLGIKSNFNKVSFEINIMYFFSKENKVLDVYSDGIFTIYKKGKVNI